MIQWPSKVPRRKELKCRCNPSKMKLLKGSSFSLVLRTRVNLMKSSLQVKKSY